MTLTGSAAGTTFDEVPRRDLVEALVAGIPGLIDDIDWDTRNVVLTLTRVWNTVVTGEIRPKDAAAEWALDRLSPEHRPVLVRAREGYLRGNESWEDLRAQVLPFARAVVAEIEAGRR